MLESLTSDFEGFSRHVRIVDFFDVALISVFLYLLLNWFIKSTSRRTIIGFSILIVVYAFARITEMYLTELLIQGLFVIILIGVVVVFQSDIRRMVDRIGYWNFFGEKKATFSNTTTDILTETTSKMAENRVGALIVIRGKEDWDRHIHGGIELQGKVSIPLLHSIFNPKAPGHDGAVLLEGDKIVRFGTHLPLSVNLSKRSAGGTRHAAALGLSEQCDALVVIVSEERGVVSVAQSGSLTEVSSGSELKSILEVYWDEHYQGQDTSVLDWWKKRNLRTAIASVVIAMLFWFAFAYQPDTVFRTFTIPIEYRNLESGNVALQDSVPPEARVTLSGSDQAFRTFDASQLVVSFNMATKNPGMNEMPITGENLNLPSDLKLYEAVPPSLKIEEKKFKKADLPVRIPTEGKLPEGLELVSLTSEPSKVRLLVSSEGENNPDSVSVAAVKLDDIQESTKLKRKLNLSRNLKLPDKGSGEIIVNIKVKKSQG